MELKELKLAKTSIKSETATKSITFDKMAEIIEKNGKKGAVFYLDRDNQEKDIKKLEAFFKKKKRAVLVRELHFTMDSKDYIYEVHIL
ncbi:hypothetical protein CQA53_05365 [Helicobacter didelphidarum]|uniref:HP0268 domain-containing protein n=1 Tax=Helicobacter didelphidarum TaxID=2040648 RepID=A0A3D8ILJ8_9HELI|nr:HP0268 family nuclease [Helicobacter didelphidarum]RDU65880.1 hypothetical protein CQA53_05365 [Helicobacter didelphidarum]